LNDSKEEEKTPLPCLQYYNYHFSMLKIYLQEMATANDVHFCWCMHF